MTVTMEHPEITNKKGRIFLQKESGTQFWTLEVSRGLLNVQMEILSKQLGR